METVGDTTDPHGMLRPNLPPEPSTGTYFEALPHPEFTYRINVPSSVNPIHPIEIWDLFFPEEIIDMLVQNTNKSSLSLCTGILEIQAPPVKTKLFAVKFELGPLQTC
jgi:hypothetical protein